MDRDKLISKIRRLQALAGNNPSEAEAAAAAERAHELIAKYQIRAEELGDKSEMTHDRSFDTNAEQWRRYIGPPLAALYFCRYGVNRRKVKTYYRDQHMFIGREANVQVCRMMFAYLCLAVDRLASRSAKGVPEEERNPFRNSFKLGCAIRLAIRLKKRLEEAKAKPTMVMSEGEANINLPALADAYTRENHAIEKYFSERFEEVDGRQRDPKPRSNAGLIAGYEAGGNIGLDQQLESGQRKQLA